MYLINSKTGKAEELTTEDMDGFERGEKPRRNGLRSRLRTKEEQAARPSKLPQHGEIDDAPVADGAPKLTRSSDYKKKQTKSTFGVKKPIPGEYSRTSDKKPKYKKRDPQEPRQKPKQAAHQYAGWLLSKREYSAAVLRRKLVMRGYSEEEADDALAHLQRLNFQSDERFAEMKTRQIEHRSGDARVAMTLKGKGIAEDLAKATIEQMKPEEERVLEVADKFRKEIAGSGLTQVLRQKIYRFLAYRGFSSKSIRAAIDHLSEP